MERAQWRLRLPGKSLGSDSLPSPFRQLQLQLDMAPSIFSIAVQPQISPHGPPIALSGSRCIHLLMVAMTLL
ncbi:hypothetical protein CSOJ01_07757 [Colletotrichum sojae]|uniref:Uncharacterized protein n=1 Tax=Colletotrichum sojae TaxID=2175907 RepID=A0A8H6MT58_9PEZI|nr:hypothetical protein CSOJ01_07757 [Colletotrichum sojae]